MKNEMKKCVNCNQEKKNFEGKTIVGFGKERFFCFPCMRKNVQHVSPDLQNRIRSAIVRENKGENIKIAGKQFNVPWKRDCNARRAFTFLQSQGKFEKDNLKLSEQDIKEYGKQLIPNQQGKNPNPEETLRRIFREHKKYNLAK